MRAACEPNQPARHACISWRRPRGASASYRPSQAHPGCDEVSLPVHGTAGYGSREEGVAPVSSSASPASPAIATTPLPEAIDPPGSQAWQRQLAAPAELVKLAIYFEKRGGVLGMESWSFLTNHAGPGCGSPRIWARLPDIAAALGSPSGARTASSKGGQAQKTPAASHRHGGAVRNGARTSAFVLDLIGSRRSRA